MKEWGTKSQLVRFVFVYIGITLALAGVFFCARYVFSSEQTIVITEICPTGCAAKDHQWVEIYNKSDAYVDISNWKFVEDDTNHGLSVSASSAMQSMVLSAKSYALIVQNDVVFFTDHPDVAVLVMDSSWSTLNKSGEEIAIKNTEGDVVEQFLYQEIQEHSLERMDVNNDAHDATNWKEHPDSNTVGVQNFWHVTEGDGSNTSNQAPHAVISAPTSTVVGEDVFFRATSSTDDGEIVSYVWQIDGVDYDGVTVNHVFTTIGTKVVTLTVTDNDGAIGTASTDIVIFDSEQQGDITTPTTTPAVATSTIFTGLVINEFVSDPVADSNEWIELYNGTTSTIDMTGFELHDGAGKLQTLSGMLEAQGFVQINLSSSKLNNGGDAIVLYFDDVVIDAVRYGDWSDESDADITNNASAPKKGESVARMSDGQDSNNDKNDFVRTTTITPSESNVITAPIEQTQSTTGGGGGASTPIETTPSVTYHSGVIVINELVSDPADDAEEFVELYNTSDEIISLDAWHIEDGSETKTVLTGSMLPKKFFVIDKPKGSLNNAGDIVLLYDPTNKEIDKVTFGNWDDGNVADNAPSAQDPYSIIRKTDGLDANNDFYDFVITGTITKGGPNVLTQITDKNGDVVPQVVGSSDIMINEVFPNPVGDDSDDEFIELYNRGVETIDLTGWKVGDSSKKRYTITSGRVTSHAYFVLKRSMTGIALNNTGGDEVKLFSQNDTLIDSMQYPGSASEGDSYVKKEDGSWAWSTTVTAGKENVIAGKSAAPLISIDTESNVAVNDWLIFDASDTIDPDGDTLTYHWDFQDGTQDDGAVVEHKFATEGVYMVSLTVSDGTHESVKDVAITVKLVSDFVGGYAGGSDVSRIKISEFLPNPTGSDTTEFIELFNPSDVDIDVSGIKVDDEEGGSRAYTIPHNTIVSARGYFVLGRQETGIALNNTSDSVRLLYPDGTIMTDVRYDDVIEGASYIQNSEGVWVWTHDVTPGAENVVRAPKDVAGTKIVKKSKSIKQTIQTTLDRVRNEDVGDSLQLAGIVTVEPGVLGTQYFYIGDGSQHASSTGGGIQVYMYSKDFPTLVRGDKIDIRGELAESSGEARVKLKTKDDIHVVMHDDIPTPRDVEIADIGEPLEGQLIRVQGEITELKGSYVYLDDGSSEVKVYFKRGAGIQKQIFNEGDLVTVAGIVHQTKSEFQVLPRDMADMQKTGVVEEDVRPDTSVGDASSNSVMEKYVIALAGGLTAIFFGLFGKTHGSRMLDIVKNYITRFTKK